MMDHMTLEELMVKAIRAFKRKYKWAAEIRSITAQEGTGSLLSGWKEATFEVEYVKVSLGEYMKAYVTVTAASTEAIVK